MALLNIGGARIVARIALALGLLLHWAPAARAQSIDEYQAKAAFLYNFAKFVDWPSASFKNDKDPIRICIFGPNPFGSTLENMVRGKDVAGRPLNAMQVSDVQQVSSCHMVFVVASACKRFKPMVAQLSAVSVLTLGETETFLSDGGMVSFKVEDGRIRFDISLGAAEQANVRISSKLLSLARVSIR